MESEPTPNDLWRNTSPASLVAWINTASDLKKNDLVKPPINTLNTANSLICCITIQEIGIFRVLAAGALFHSS